MFRDGEHFDRYLRCITMLGRTSFAPNDSAPSAEMACAHHNLVLTSSISPAPTSIRNRHPPTTEGCQSKCSAAPSVPHQAGALLSHLSGAGLRSAAVAPPAPAPAPAHSPLPLRSQHPSAECVGRSVCRARRSQLATVRGFDRAFLARQLWRRPIPLTRVHQRPYIPCLRSLWCSRRVESRCQV